MKGTPSMSIITSRRRLGALSLLAGAGAAASLAGLVTPAIAGNQLAVAISGFDATSFHSGTPERGIPRFNAFFNGGIWYFRSEATRDLFVADPARYAPQFDGYCSWAASEARKAPGNPEFWRIVDGRLYLQVHEQAQQNWLRDVPGNITRANTAWPRVHPF